MTEDADFEREVRSLLSDADYRDAETARRFAGGVFHRVALRRRMRFTVLWGAGAIGLVVSLVELDRLARAFAGARESWRALAGPAASLGADMLGWASIAIAAGVAVFVLELTSSASRL